MSNNLRIVLHSCCCIKSPKRLHMELQKLCLRSKQQMNINGKVFFFLKFPFYNVGKLNVRILPKNTRSNLVQMKDEKLEMNHKICWRCVHFLTERRQEKKESYIRIKRGQVTDLQKKCDFSKVLLCVIAFPRLSRNRTAACGASVIMRENGKAWSRQISEFTTCFGRNRDDHLLVFYCGPIWGSESGCVQSLGGGTVTSTSQRTKMHLFFRSASVECCTSLRRTANGKRCILASTVAVICVFIALAGEWSPEVTCPLSAAAPFSSVDCNRLTHWPRLVKQHAKSCLPPVAVCEECSKLRPLFSFFSFFLPCRPSMSFLIMFLCEQGQGCWHRPSVISLTRHCHEQTRRDHPALGSISLSQGNSFSLHHLFGLWPLIV